MAPMVTLLYDLHNCTMHGARSWPQIRPPPLPKPTTSASHWWARRTRLCPEVGPCLHPELTQGQVPEVWNQWRWRPLLHPTMRVVPIQSGYFAASFNDSICLLFDRINQSNDNIPSTWQVQYVGVEPLRAFM